MLVSGSLSSFPLIGNHQASGPEDREHRSVKESRLGRLRLQRRLAAHARSSERGAAAVEFALVAMLLLTIFLAIIQFAVLFWSLNVAEHASREGARAYATAPCGNHTALVSDRVGPASAGNLSVSRSFPGAYPPAAGDQVTVTVSFDIRRLDGGFLGFLPESVTEDATARVEDVEEC